MNQPWNKLNSNDKTKLIEKGYTKSTYISKRLRNLEEVMDSVLDEILDQQK